MKSGTLLSSLLFLAVSTACSGEVRPPRSDEGRPIKMITVGDAGTGVEREYYGTIAAAQEVRIGFEVPGQIIELPATAGQRVEAGDLLAKLDATNFVATRDAARAQLEAARADVERKRNLVEVGGVSRAALEEAERRFTAAGSDLATAEKALSDTELRAPFAGVIATRYQENFANVVAKQGVFALQDPSWMEIEVAIPEADAALAVPGLTLEERNQRLEARVVVSALPGREFSAACSEFSTSADPVARTYSATFVFETPQDVSVLAGMTAQLRLRSSGRQGSAKAYRLPAQVVAGDERKEPYVWVIGEDMRVAKRPVEVAEMTGSMIEVTGGLEVGERVALTGVQQLHEGLRVREWEVE